MGPYDRPTYGELKRRVMSKQRGTRTRACRRVTADTKEKTLDLYRQVFVLATVVRRNVVKNLLCSSPPSFS